MKIAKVMIEGREPIYLISKDGRISVIAAIYSDAYSIEILEGDVKFQTTPNGVDISAYCEAIDIDPAKILARHNRFHYERIAIAFSMRRNGATLKDIGRAMSRDHSTISHYLADANHLLQNYRNKAFTEILKSLEEVGSELQS